MKKSIYLFVIIGLSMVVLTEGYMLISLRNSQECPKTKPSHNIFGKFSTMENFNPPKGYEDIPEDIPVHGYIPDYKTAIKIAESIWHPIFGKEIYNDTPFNATLLQDSLWIVSGSIPPNTDGGSYYIKLRKNDGQILNVTRLK